MVEQQKEFSDTDESIDKASIASGSKKMLKELAEKMNKQANNR